MTEPFNRSNPTDNKDPVRVPDADASGEIMSTTEKIRQGHTGDKVRRVLVISFAGAALALGIVYAAFFL